MTLYFHSLTAHSLYTETVKRKGIFAMILEITLSALHTGKKSFAFSFTHNEAFNTLFHPRRDHPPSEIVKKFY